VISGSNVVGLGSYEYGEIKFGRQYTVIDSLRGASSHLTLSIVPDATYGDKKFDSKVNVDRVLSFLNRYFPVVKK